jgi:UTP--glucose-1-phosphate uridylyltransferase
MRLTQAILPVAGYGTRFLPWTKVVPKELLPIGKRPIIALLVDECLSVGIKDICFVISKGKEAIPAFFQTDAALEKELARRGKMHLLEELAKYHEVRFHTVYQNEMHGDGHAILQAKDWVKSEQVAVLFGDDLIAGEKTGLEELHEAVETISSKKNVGMLCLQNVPRESVSRYGVVQSTKKAKNIHTVQGLVEKPKPQEAPSTLAVVGKYIIPKSTIETLVAVESSHSDGEIRLIDALKSQVEKGEIELFGCEVQGRRFDTGTWEGYKEAVQEIG